jgi:hypothetical protein
MRDFNLLANRSLPVCANIKISMKWSIAAWNLRCFVRVGLFPASARTARSGLQPNCIGYFVAPSRRTKRTAARHRHAQDSQLVLPLRLPGHGTIKVNPTEDQPQRHTDREKTQRKAFERCCPRAEFLKLILVFSVHSLCPCDSVVQTLSRGTITTGLSISVWN